MRLITDVFAFCAEQVPRWNTISVSGYHIREAGATAAQELAFTLRDGIEYVQYGIDAGLDVDVFAPRMSFFFNSHSDFFEEIAKFRAARRIWARVMRDRFEATVAAVVAAALPRADGRRVAHRAAAVQQRRADGAAGAGRGARRHAVAAHQRARRGAGAADGRGGDAGAADAADHRARNRRDRAGRSARRVVLRREADTRSSRRRRSPTSTRSTAWAAWSRRSSAAIPQREIAESAYRFQQAVEAREQIIVGVNDFVETGGDSVGTLYIDETGGRAPARQARRVARAARRGRCDGRWRRCRPAAGADANTMPLLLDAVRAYATIGEMCDSLRDVWGEYVENASNLRDRAQGSGIRDRPDQLHGARKSESSSPSRGSTATTAAPRSLPARCATPAWR